MTSTVLVTGGTGYVGSHCVRSLLAAGHGVRLLVRDPEAVEPLLNRRLDLAEWCVGDVTDVDSVRRAMAGCEAVVHAASVYSMHSSDRRRIKNVNAKGTAIVLDAADAAGLIPIVHVSSIVALDASSAQLDLARSAAGHYAASKIASEATARQRASEGAPVVIAYPGAVWGPDDPRMGESARLARGIARRRLPALPPGGLSIVDVRDLADALAALITRGATRDRVVLAGTYVSFVDLVDLIAQLTHRRLPTQRWPASVMRGVGRAADVIQRVVPTPLTATAEGITTATRALQFPDQPAWAELGVEPRPLVETVEDTLEWLVAHDALPAKLAPGRAA